MKKTIKKFIVSRWPLSFIYHLVRLYSKTFRLTIENERQWTDFLKNGGRVVLCTWHQQFFSAVNIFDKYRNYSPALMISASSDGDIVAEMAKLNGWHPVRGSSSKGGKRALVQLIRHLKEKRLSGHIVDGPRGPMGIVKAGLIHMAVKADAGIVPFYFTADRAWFFKSWDRFMIPRPFAKVTLRYNNIITVCNAATPDEIEEQRKRIENIMIKGLKKFSPVIDEDPAL